MHCSLLASGIFLKVEIKSMTKNVWNQGFADLQTLPVSTARLGGYGHSGGPAKQNMPEGWGSWAALPSPQNSARENPHRSPEKCSIRLG